MKWIYEVNLRVQAEVRDDYLAWLRQHIDEMIALPTFHSAQLWADEQGEWVVHYYADSKEAIDRYLQHFASQMRGDGLARFEGKFEAQRRILGPLRAE